MAPSSDVDGVLVVPAGVPGLVWHPLPLAPNADGTVQDPGVWAGRVAPGGRWAVEPRPVAGWVPPAGWGEPVAAALARYGEAAAPTPTQEPHQ